MGDSAGIGPAVVAKASPRLRESSRPVVVGDHGTAFDNAGEAIASEANLVDAAQVAGETTGDAA